MKCVELDIIFPSAFQASRYLREHTDYKKAAPSSIVRCARGEKRSAFGFTWKFP